MLRHTIHAVIIGADITAQAVVNDAGVDKLLMLGAAFTVLLSAYVLVRDCSAELFAPPRSRVAAGDPE